MHDMHVTVDIGQLCSDEQMRTDCCHTSYSPETWKTGTQFVYGSIALIVVYTGVEGLRFLARIEVLQWR